LLKSENTIKHVCLYNDNQSEIDITNKNEAYYLITLTGENTPFGDKDKPVLIKSGNNMAIPIDLTSIKSSGYYLNSGIDRKNKPFLKF